MSTDPMQRLEQALLALNKDGVLAEVAAVVASPDPARAQAAVDAISGALQIVGKRFQDGDWFLGELVYSGEIAKAAMAQLSPRLESTGAEKPGVIVVGTVLGDLHDLGKDIFVNYARSSGFDVIDLGVNVAIDEFEAAATEHQPLAVGMSCLLTSCAGSVGDVIERLSRNGMRDGLKIIVGGAALTEAFASEAGADAFAADAVTGSDIVRAWSSGT